MVLRLIALVSLSTIIIGCTEETSKWVEVGNTYDMHFYVTKEIEKGPRSETSLIGVNMLWDYNYPQIRSEGVFKSVVVKLLIDCHRAMAADFGYTNYTDNMATGSVVASGERNILLAEHELREIQNPSAKAVANFACKEAGKS